MKKGLYIVGDLCYLFNDDTWQELCDTVFEKDQNNCEVKGVPMWWHHTKYGDGSYDWDDDKMSELISTDKRYKPFPVDSGTIGIVHIGILDTGCTKITLDGVMKNNSGLQLFDMKIDFDCYCVCGTFSINTLHIYTGEAYEEDEEEDEYNPWEDM